MPDTDDIQNDDANNEPELVLDDVVELEVDDLSDEHKTFLEENKGDLSTEHLEKFGLEVDDIVDPDDIEVETRGKEAEEKVDEKDDEDLDGELEKEVKALRKKVKMSDNARDNEKDVESFISKNPEYKKYEGVMLKFINSPSWNDVPIQAIANHVSAKEQQKIGASKERAAAKKARDSKSGGTQVRKKTTEGIDWKKASSEEVNAQIAKVKGMDI